MKRILVISRGSWNNNNSIGNTLNNFFASAEGCEFYNVYMRSELPGEHPCKSIYRISEVDLIKSLKSFKQVGTVISSHQQLGDSKREESLYRSFQNRNFYSLWFLRDMLWIIGRWRKKLINYIGEIKPDVIFMPVFGCVYAHRLLQVIHKSSNARVVLFHADDHYTLRHRNYSPFYWLYRFWLRAWIRHSVKLSSINYCISDLQISDYNRCFRTHCKLLQKFGDFSGDKPTYTIASPINITFTGNMECGRWKSLAALAEAVHRINSESNALKCTLNIYSATKLLPHEFKMFENQLGVSLQGFVQSSMIPSIQTQADILVHVESFDSSDKLRVRQSFSTKIVDYLTRGKCILAIGPSDVASIQYFEKYDSGVVIDCPSMIYTKVSQLLDDKSLMEKYAEQAWKCGYNNNNYHKREEFIQTLLNL